MLRAGRPVNARVTSVCSGGVRDSASAQAGVQLHLGATQEPRSDLDGAGAEHQRRGHAARVGDAPGGHHGDPHGIRHRGQQREQPDHPRLGVLRPERCRDDRPLRSPGDDRIAPAASACFASSTEVAVANQATPRPFRRATNSGGNSPMMDDTATGPACSMASHCCWNVSRSWPRQLRPGPPGPSWPRNVRTRASCVQDPAPPACGPGIQLLSWNGTAASARTALTHSAISARAIISTPAAPIPPALPTAMDIEGGQAPAMGASRIGHPQPEALAEALGAVQWSIVHAQAPVVGGASLTPSGDPSD